jgi:hypothetical protein
MYLCNSQLPVFAAELIKNIICWQEGHSVSDGAPLENSLIPFATTPC